MVKKPRGRRFILLVAFAAGIDLENDVGHFVEEGVGIALSETSRVKLGRFSCREPRVLEL